MVDSSTQAFDDARMAYGAAEADVQAAVARRDSARRAVMRARPSGMTTLEVARWLKAADADIRSGAVWFLTVVPYEESIVVEPAGHEALR